MLESLDDQNMKMDIIFHVRVGINTGGPIMADVLENENRVFDIIGDAINVAPMPDPIQMTFSTQKHIAKRGFPLHQRENVALKGKKELSQHISFTVMME
jgi:hypothetical protein